ncbi:DUF748 domain-containing protein [Sulfurospirillum sp. 1307]
MKYLKSFWFWIGFLFLTYNLVGFLLIPWFVTSKLPTILKDKIGLHVEVSDASFNPYEFDLKLHNIVLKDLNKKPVLGVKFLHVDYSFLGLLEKTILFKTLDINSPKLYTSILQDGKLNLQNIIKTSNTKEVKTEQKPQQLPIIKLEKLNIKDGNIKFNDFRDKKQFELNFGPYDFMAHDISTKAGDLNGYAFKTKVGKNGEILWEGGMRIEPLNIYGKINLTNLELPKLYDYALSDLEAKLTSGNISFELPYKIDLSKDLQASINDAKITLSNIIMKDKTNTLFDLAKIDVNSLNLKWPEQKISIDSLNLQSPKVFASLDKKYQLNLLKAFEMKESNSTSKKESKPWDFLLKEANINEANVIFEDNSLDNPIKSELSKTTLHVKNISLDKQSPIDFDLMTDINKNAKLKAKGQIKPEPLIVSSKIDLKNLNISDYKNYLSKFVNFDINNADLSIMADLDVDFSKSKDIKLIADTSIDKLVINQNNGEKLLSWNQLKINGIKYNNDDISIKNLELKEPYIRAHVNKDGSTNFSNLTKPSSSKEEKTSKEPLKLKIGPMVLTKGSSDFSDFSLPFPFKTYIHDLNGEFSTLDFQKTTPSTLKLKGKIDKYGYTNINGVLSPFNIKENAKINVLFKNIDLSSITPYSMKFLGYKIKNGKLSMDLKYDIKKAKLIGDNKINIDTLTLGEKVESKDAPSLPLELAIAILKDSNGQIDIDLPVTGNMNDPQFSYGSIIWRAIGNMITGIVTAPFRFLGSMLGIKGDDLKAIDFEIGSYKIISSEYEKLDNLNKILSKKPGIKLSITGAYNKDLDTYELQKQKFKIIINKELAKDTNSTNDVYGSALKTLYVKDFSQKEYEDLQKLFIIKPKKDDNKTKKTKKPQINIIAFNNEVQTKITKNIKISQKELENLANKRAKSVKSSLISKYKISKERIKILAPKEKEAKRDRWIGCELEIAI